MFFFITILLSILYQFLQNIGSIETQWNIDFKGVIVMKLLQVNNRHQDSVTMTAVMFLVLIWNNLLPAGF